MHRAPVRTGWLAAARSRTRLPCVIALTAVLPLVLTSCTSSTGHSRPSLSPPPASSINSDDASPAAGAATSTPPATASLGSTPLGGTSPSSTSPSHAARSTPPNTATPSARATATAAAPPAQPTAAAPRFTSAITTVTAGQLGASWHAGCPVGPTQLRQISLTYWGFDGIAHSGAIVVNASVVTSVIKVFAALYAERFPIRRMEPVSNFGGSDDASMAVDNTSGFNCRNAVTQGPPAWSAHAYGEAIDVNTIENPYLEGGKVLPPEGAAYAKRTPYRPGMAVAGGQLVKAFAAVAWLWGGRWTGSPDYQHFSSTGG